MKYKSSICDINKIFQKCTIKADGNVRLITASDIRTFVVSPFNLWCNFFAPKEERDPESEYEKILEIRGVEHEENYVKEEFPCLQPIKAETKEEAFKLCLEGFVSRTQIFVNPPLFYLPENLMSVPDILQLDKSHNSIFGKYCYIVKDVKSAKNIDDKHIFPTAFHNYIISKIQGFTPNTFYIINRDKEIIPFDYDDYYNELLRIIKEIREIANGKEVTPTIGSVVYPWEKYGLKRAYEIGDISLIPGIGPKKKSALELQGIRTIKDIRKADNSKLSKCGLGAAALDKVLACATAIQKNVIVFRESPRFPISKTEIFLDIESTDFIQTENGFDKIIYLIGLIKRVGKKSKYSSFVSKKIKDERKMLSGFLQFIVKEKDCVIYHYSPYERTELRNLFEKYKVSKKIADSISSKMVDLYPIVMHSVALPVHSFSLKYAARVMGFEWSDTAMDAQKSISLYLQYLEDRDENKLKHVIEYNEDDCRATVVVKDFLLRESKNERKNKRPPINHPQPMTSLQRTKPSAKHGYKPYRKTFLVYKFISTN